jgi:hypothetical protein
VVLTIEIEFSGDRYFEIKPLQSVWDTTLTRYRDPFDKPYNRERPSRSDAIYDYNAGFIQGQAIEHQRMVESLRARDEEKANGYCSRAAITSDGGDNPQPQRLPQPPIRQEQLRLRQRELSLVVPPGRGHLKGAMAFFYPKTEILAGATL